MNNTKKDRLIEAIDLLAEQVPNGHLLVISNCFEELLLKAANMIRCQNESTTKYEFRIDKSKGVVVFGPSVEMSLPYVSQIDAPKITNAMNAAFEAGQNSIKNKIKLL